MCCAESNAEMTILICFCSCFNMLLISFVLATRLFSLQSQHSLTHCYIKKRLHIFTWNGSFSHYPVILGANAYFTLIASDQVVAKISQLSYSFALLRMKKEFLDSILTLTNLKEYLLIKPGTCWAPLLTWELGGQGWSRHTFLPPWIIPWVRLLLTAWSFCYKHLCS